MNNGRRVYILVHSTTAATHDKMKEYLNSIKEIDTWRTDLSNCFYIISELSADVLSKRIRNKTGEKGRFIVAELSENSHGWLTPESWFFIRNKKLKPSK